MSYYDGNKDYAQRGIDWDLHEAVSWNWQMYTVDDIEKVLAAYEGESDGGENWRWVFQLKNTRYIFLTAWCSYTGWDIAGLDSFFLPRFGNIIKTTESDETFFYAHASAALAKHEENRVVIENLVEQIKSGKRETWREKTDRFMGLGQLLQEIDFSEKDDDETEA